MQVTWDLFDACAKGGTMSGTLTISHEDPDCPLEDTRRNLRTLVPTQEVGMWRRVSLVVLSALAGCAVEGDVLPVEGDQPDGASEALEPGFQAGDVLDLG